MKLVLATAGVLVTMSASASAHRLDEYLQAARVSLEQTRVALEVDLTPGASVADAIISRIDRDNDGRISALEAESYGREVLTDVVLEVDDRPVALTLSYVEVPSLDEMRHGLGAIQLRAGGDVEPRTALRRQIHFQNNHQTGTSVYLVNALVPADRDITVESQTRDTKQRGIRIQYRMSPQWARYLYWPIFGLAVGGWWFITRRPTNH